jgi:hypothetical protein
MIRFDVPGDFGQACLLLKFWVQEWRSNESAVPTSMRYMWLAKFEPVAVANLERYLNRVRDSSSNDAYFDGAKYER